MQEGGFIVSKKEANRLIKFWHDEVQRFLNKWWQDLTRKNEPTSREKD